MIKITILSLALLVMIPVIVYGSHQQESSPIEDECIFTAYLEKSWIFFQERPWVTGFVINCDSKYFEYYTSNEGHYYKIDTVFVRILDIDGNLVKDTWELHSKTDSIDYIPTKYIFTDSVFRGYGFGHMNNEFGKTVQLQTNQYFFYMPQIWSLEFEHRGVYQIELTYGDHVRTIWFATLDPDMWWEDEKVDPCIGYEVKLASLTNAVDVLKEDLDRWDIYQNRYRYQLSLDEIDKIEKQIEEWKICIEADK